MKETKTVQGRKGQKGSSSRFDIAFKRMVGRHYAEGNESLHQVAAHYGVSHFSVSRWSRQFSAELSEPESDIEMTEQEQRDFESLKKQNEQLKKKLEYEQMRTFALETMIDLAKEKLGVDVRKNFGAKQPEE